MENQVETTNKMETTNNRFTTFDHTIARNEINSAIEGLSDKKTGQYFEGRITEFFDRYDYCAEPSETATILTKNSVKAMMAEWSVFLAQREQSMNYMGQHPAETFSKAKPSALLKEFGEWLVSASEYAEWDWED